MLGQKNLQDHVDTVQSLQSEVAEYTRLKTHHETQAAQADIRLLGARNKLRKARRGLARHVLGNLGIAEDDD